MDTAQTQSIIRVAAAMLIVVIGDSLARPSAWSAWAPSSAFRAGVKDPRDVACCSLMIGLGMACGLGLIGRRSSATLFVALVLAIFDRFAHRGGAR